MKNVLTSKTINRIGLKRNNHRNTVFTPTGTQCRLCHYAGVTNICDFFQNEPCPYIEIKKDIRRNNKNGIKDTQKNSGVGSL